MNGPWQDLEHDLLALRPVTVREDLGGDAAAVSGLVSVAHGGDWLALLSHPCAEPVATALGKDQQGSSLEDLRAAVDKAVEAVISNGPGGVTAALAIAVGALQAFCQINWTGPKAPASWVDVSLVHPENDGEDDEPTPLLKAIREDLGIDGEPLSDHARGAGMLWLSTVVLAQVSSKTPTGFIWQARAAFVWQRALQDANDRGIGYAPTLLKRCVETFSVALNHFSILPLEAFSAVRRDFVRTEITLSMPLDLAEDEIDSLMPLPEAPQFEGHTWDHQGLPALVKACLLVELVVRLSFYGRTRGVHETLRAACAHLDFDYKLSALMGIKRAHQKVAHAQLTCMTRSVTREGGGAGESAPNQLKLNEIDDMTDILERPRLEVDGLEEGWSVDTPLDAPELCVLLAVCQWKWLGANPNDELMHHEVNALAMRAVALPAQPKEAEGEGMMLASNWLVFSTALWYKCRAEFSRSKTRERAVFQFEVLVNQYSDEKPSGQHRLLFNHTLPFPARWHAQQELGKRMCMLGLVLTAYEMYKTLRMWGEAVDCLVIVDRKNEAKELIQKQMEVRKTPHLVCSLGELDNDPQYFEQAWELSNKKYARAQRLLGHYHFQKGNMQAAIDAYTLALAINPLHKNIWFTRGIALMRIQQIKEAAASFVRAIGVEDEDYQVWGNLAACHTQLGNFKEARMAIGEASRHGRDHWRIWESYLQISMNLVDLHGVLRAFKRLCELGRGPHLHVGALQETVKWVHTDQKLFDSKLGARQMATKVYDCLKLVTDTVPSKWRYWRLRAILEDILTLATESYASHMAEFRHLQSEVWEADFEHFPELITELAKTLDTLSQEAANPAISGDGKVMQELAMVMKNVEQKLEKRPEVAHAKLEGKEPSPVCSKVLELAARVQSFAAQRSGLAEEDEDA